MCAGERKTKTASESNSSKSQQEDSLTASAVRFSTTRIQFRVCEFGPAVEDIGPSSLRLNSYRESVLPEVDSPLVGCLP